MRGFFFNMFLGFFVVICLPVFSQEKMNKAPYAPYWHISDLLEWNPLADVDAEFNRSNTPLATKFLNPEFKVNDHAHCNEAKVNILSIFAPTSDNPAQGGTGADYYAFTYWQYVDLLVFWGGAAKEGIILSSNAGVIDAAHRHGVPVYGTIFFPPIYYGGKREWVYEFIQKDGDTFPVADKLIQVAKYYGFDGWFINQESGNIKEVVADSSLAVGVRDFMIYFQNHSDLGLEWYDAMLEDGRVDWQHELNDQNDMFFQYGDTLVAENMFLDFRSTKRNLQNTRMKAERLNRDLYDVFASIDVQQYGYETTPGYEYPAGANFDVIFPEGKPHAASLAMYVPSWTYSSSSGLVDFHKRESRFWVGVNNNPAQTNTAHNWKGIAHYVPAKSSVNSIPFVTNFCVGHGDKYFLEGKDITSPVWDNGWNNLAIQDIQPTWRWVMDAGCDPLSVNYCFDDAFNGGNCVLVRGKLKAENILSLYSTDIELSKKSIFIITSKKDSFPIGDAKVGLTFKGKSGTMLFDITMNKDFEWQTDSISLSDYKGEIVSKISLHFSSGRNEDFALKIGQIGITEVSRDKPMKPEGLHIISKNVNQTKNTCSLRLGWDAISDTISYYCVYCMNSDGKLAYSGATTSTSCYLQDLVCDDNGLTILVESVSEDFLRSERSVVKLVPND